MIADADAGQMHLILFGGGDIARKDTSLFQRLWQRLTAGQFRRIRQLAEDEADATEEF